MKKIMLSMAVIAIAFVSCEKEESMNFVNPDATANEQGKVKNGNKNNNSGATFSEDYWNDVDGFVYQFVKNEEYDSDLEANKALYYIESTLDFQLTGHQDNVVERREGGAELNYSIIASNNGVVWELSSSQITSIRSNVYSDISGQASALAASVGASVLVDIVDLQWVMDQQSGVIELQVNAVLGLINNNLAFPNGCGLLDAKVNVSQRCSGNSGRMAKDEIDFYLRPLCGTWNNRLNCVGSNSIVLNPMTTQFNALTPCGSYVVGSLPWGSCRTAADNQADFDGTRNAWNSHCLPGIGSKIRSAGYTSGVNSGHSISNHLAEFYTATGCRVICNQPFGCPPIHRPFPIF